MGKLFGGKTSSTTVVNVPEPTETERQLQEVQLDIAQRQLKLFEQQDEAQGEAFDVLTTQLTQLNEATQAALAQASESDPIFKEIAELQLETLRRGGRATEEEKQLIADATTAASEQGKSDIETFRDESIENVRNVLGPSRGLRPGDRPVTLAGERIGTEATRQFGQLQRGLREVQANAELNFPLARDQLLSSVGGFQQQLAESARNFQSNIRQQAFQNQLQLQAFRQSGPLALLGSPAPGSQLLAQLSQNRLAQASTTSTQRQTPGLGAVALQLLRAGGTAMSGAGAVGIGFG